jgi:hypothetical protein
MDEEDSFVVKEGEPDDDYYAPDPDSAYEDRYDLGDEQEMSYDEEGDEDEMSYDEEGEEEMDENYDMEEEMMYEIDMPEGGYGMESMSDEGYMDEMSDEDINEMLSEMDIEEDMDSERYKLRKVGKASGISNLNTRRDFRDDRGINSPAERVEKTHREKGLEGSSIHEFMDEDMFNEDVPASEQGSAYRTQEKNRHFKGPIHEKSELEGMFEEMSMEELEEMNSMLEGGDMGKMMHSKKMNDMSYKTLDSSMDDETDLTEAEIEEMLYSMKEEEEIEESSAIPSQTKMNRGNRGGGSVQGRPERRSGMLAEEDDEDVESLKEQLKKLKQENKSLNEGFTNKVKSLENKVYDVTISALKAGFVNKFLLEHPLRENEKLQIIHRFTNAQTKEQIKETYISLTNEFAKGQTVKDGSMLNESVQNKVGKVHRTDNAIVTEKNLMNESDESNRFKQLLNYNFNKKK